MAAVGTRTGPLAWGQYLPWVTENAAPESGPHLKILTFDVVAPEGVSADDALRILDEIVSRYEGLRTGFERTGATVTQVVHPWRPRGYRCAVSDVRTFEGEPPLEQTEWLNEPFDLAGEWPLRVAVWYRVDGRCVIRLAAHRMILDHEGMIVIRSHFSSGFRSGSIETVWDRSEPPAWEPIDIAEFEGSATGQRRDQRAFEYWRRALMTAPASLFATARPQRPTDSRFAVRLARADLRPVVSQLAAAFQVTEPSVLTAAALLALSWTGGWPVVCASVIANNRSHRGMRRSLSPMLDRTLVSVVADPARTFGGWVGGIGASTIGAYKHSHADPNTLLRAYAVVGLERGMLFDRLPILNIMADPMPTVVRESLTSGTDIGLPPGLPDEYETSVIPKPLDGLYLRARLMWRRVSLQLLVGEEVFDLPTAERLVALVVSILEALAKHGDLTLGKLAVVVPDGPREAASFERVDNTRVDLAALASILGEIDGVSASAAFVRDENGVARLYACLASDLRDLPALRRAVLGRLPSHRHVLCPQWFRLVRTAPERPDRYEAWLTQPAVVEGSGWPAPPRFASGQAEVALAEAFAALHPPTLPGQVDLALPYCLAGGRFERVPGVLSELAARGIDCISVDDLMGTQLLVNLARPRSA